MQQAAAQAQASEIVWWATEILAVEIEENFMKSRKFWRWNSLEHNSRHIYKLKSNRFIATRQFHSTNIQCRNSGKSCKTIRAIMINYCSACAMDYWHWLVQTHYRHKLVCLHLWSSTCSINAHLRRPVNFRCRLINATGEIVPSESSLGTIPAVSK